MTVGGAGLRLASVLPWRGSGSTVEKIGVAARASLFTVARLGSSVAAECCCRDTQCGQRVSTAGRCGLGPLGFEPRTKELRDIYFGLAEEAEIPRCECADVGCNLRQLTRSHPEPRG